MRLYIICKLKPEVTFNMGTKPPGNMGKKTLSQYDKVIASLEGVQRKGAFMPYTSINGHMFSFLDNTGRLALRLPLGDLETFIKKHHTKMCVAHGTVLKEYVVVPVTLLNNTKQLSTYFNQSFNYVKSLKPKTVAKKIITGKSPAIKKAKSIAASATGITLVDEFLRKKKHPLDAEIRRVREIILQTSDKITEDIKWSSPTFMYKGNIASFFLNAKKHVSLMFHYGALLPNKSGLLEGEGTTGRVAKFESINDIEKKKKALQSVIKEWITLKDVK